MLDPAVIEALRLLIGLIGDERFVIIGATVPRVLIDQGLAGGRATRDVDAVLRVDTWEEFQELTRRLVTVGFRLRGAPHRFEYGRAEIDLIPYSRALAPGGRLQWPGEDRAMSTLGIEEAFASARPVRVGDLVVPMVPVAGCVLLKLIAYNDRPLERARDLVDILHCFDRYGADTEIRRYEIGEVEADDRAVLYEEAGAYLLGQEVAGLGHSESLVTVRSVLASIDDEYARPIQQILSEEGRRLFAETRRQELYRLFRVFTAGLA